VDTQDFAWLGSGQAQDSPERSQNLGISERVPKATDRLRCSPGDVLSNPVKQLHSLRLLRRQGIKKYGDLLNRERVHGIEVGTWGRGRIDGLAKLYGVATLTYAIVAHLQYFSACRCQVHHGS
jgi:hypothetical protein